MLVSYKAALFVIKKGETERGLRNKVPHTHEHPQVLVGALDAGGKEDRLSHIIQTGAPRTPRHLPEPCRVQPILLGVETREVVPTQQLDSPLCLKV